MIKYVHIPIFPLFSFQIPPYKSFPLGEAYIPYFTFSAYKDTTFPVHLQIFDKKKSKLTKKFPTTIFQNTYTQRLNTLWHMTKLHFLSNLTHYNSAKTSDLGAFLTFGMHFEWCITSYTLYLIGLYSIGEAK